jgi:hypothetical protein
MLLCVCDRGWKKDGRMVREGDGDGRRMAEKTEERMKKYSRSGDRHTAGNFL